MATGERRRASEAKKNKKRHIVCLPPLILFCEKWCGDERKRSITRPRTCCRLVSGGVAVSLSVLLKSARRQVLPALRCPASALSPQNVFTSSTCCSTGTYKNTIYSFINPVIRAYGRFIMIYLIMKRDENFATVAWRIFNFAISI